MTGPTQLRRALERRELGQGKFHGFAHIPKMGWAAVGRATEGCGLTDPNRSQAIGDPESTATSCIILYVWKTRLEKGGGKA
jgi:hypothetical protein